MLTDADGCRLPRKFSSPFYREPQNPEDAVWPHGFPAANKNASAVGFQVRRIYATLAGTKISNVNFTNQNASAVGFSGASLPSDRALSASVC